MALSSWPYKQEVNILNPKEWNMEENDDESFDICES